MPADAKPRRRTAPRGDASPGAACAAASILALLVVVVVVVVVVMLSSPSRRAAGNPPSTPLSLPASAHTRADAATLLHDAQTMLSFLKRHTGPRPAEAPPKRPQPEQQQSTPAIPPPPPPPPPPPTAPAQAATPPKDPWLARLAGKLACAQQRRGAVYLYHVRKVHNCSHPPRPALPAFPHIISISLHQAAGTTVRDVLTTATARWGVPLHETEGVTMHPSAVAVPGLLTVLTLRDPIARVFSMYWYAFHPMTLRPPPPPHRGLSLPLVGARYEHVGWYDGILHETQRCKPLATWVDAWLDGSPWKTAFMRKVPFLCVSFCARPGRCSCNTTVSRVAQNPSNVYVEVENYYVKMLSGWAGPGPVGEADYAAAVAALEVRRALFPSCFGPTF